MSVSDPQWAGDAADDQQCVQQNSVRLRHAKGPTGLAESATVQLAGLRRTAVGLSSGTVQLRSLVANS